MWISFHCDHLILEDPGKSGKTVGPIPQKVYKVQYSPSFGVRIFRKFFALAATTLFLVPLCSLWSWSKKSDSLYQCILEKHKVTKWFNRKFDFLSTNLLEVGEDSITALFLQLFQCWQPMGCREKLASRDANPVHKMRPPVCSYSVNYFDRINSSWASPRQLFHLMKMWHFNSPASFSLTLDYRRCWTLIMCAELSASCPGLSGLLEWGTCIATVPKSYTVIYGVVVLFQVLTNIWWAKNVAVMAASRLSCHICELPTKQSFTLKGGSKYFVPF